MVLANTHPDVTVVATDKLSISKDDVRALVLTAQRAPHPVPCSHCRVAAKARAAVDRPEPGGPVMSQACASEPSGEAARRNCATACSWPTTSSHTLMPPPP